MLLAVHHEQQKSKRYTLPECSQQTKEICLFNTMTLNLAVSGITTLTSWPKLEDGSYQLIEVKGDNKIDDTVVKAKAAAAQEMAVASGIEYKMYSGSEIMTTHILTYLDGMSSTINYADYMQQSTLSMVAETPAPYGSDK